MNENLYKEIVRDVAQDTAEEILTIIKSQSGIVVAPPSPEEELSIIPQGEPNPEAGTDEYIQKTSAKKVIIEEVAHVEQAAQEWAAHEIGEVGHKGSTCQKKGCAISGLCSIAAFHLKVAVNPLTLDAFLKANNGYMYGNAVVWGALVTLFNKYGLEAAFREEKVESMATDAIEEIRSQIDQGSPVLLRVSYEKGPHFLVGIGYIEEKSGAIRDIIIHDPGTFKGNGYGTKACTPSTFYGNPNHRFTLEGVLIYEVSGTPVRPA